MLNSSVSEEEGRIEVVEEISGVLTSIGIPIRRTGRRKKGRRR